MPYRIATTSAVGVIVLAVLGAVMGPQWDPVPLADPLEVQSADTAIGGAPDGGEYDVRTSVVTVQLEGTEVEALISEPVGAPADRAGIVFVHGAGTGRFTDAFVKQAHDLAASGVVTMVPDKRLDTYSTRHRNYPAMARDYQASVELLRQWPGVDPDAVGVYAESEGGWIAPIMAAESDGVGFVVLVSSPVVPPRQQAAFAVDSYLRNTDVPSGVFRAIPRAVGMSLPGGGFEYADFDVTPYQRRTHQPVFIAYGTGDASMPTVQGAETLIRDLAIAGNDQYTVRYYADADHGIRVHGTVDPDFVRDVSGWVRGLPATGDAEPRIAGDEPMQMYWASPVPTPRWLASGDAVLATVVAAAALIAVGPLLWVLLRVARRPRPPGGRLAQGTALPLALLGVGAVVTVAALVAYLVAVARLALNYDTNGVVVQGGWVALRLLGIAVVVAGAVLVERARAAREGGRPVAGGVVARTTLWGGVVGSVVLLVVLAYWGVFQLGI